ncbi:hypothetical protein CIT25_27015 [Mesorhizobium mediterraneum]|uniref:Uncharacterized protein n=1 Tax=Mesorhizobium mediterraneum TaxID=43617 RepID=A0AB36R405_9HYPH|nr:hypothetical protein CIT25_27015 [Mesorhizobium mediterraneum]
MVALGIRIHIGGDHVARPGDTAHHAPDTCLAKKIAGPECTCEIAAFVCHLASGHFRPLLLIGVIRFLEILTIHIFKSIRHGSRRALKIVVLAIRMGIDKIENASSPVFLIAYRRPVDCYLLIWIDICKFINFHVLKLITIRSVPVRIYVRRVGNRADPGHL